MKPKKVTNTESWLFLGSFSNEFKNLPLSLRRFWSYADLDNVPANHGLVVLHHGQVVAFFRFLLSASNKKSDMSAAGTWVARKFRGQGLAKKMWMDSIKRYRVRWVDVTTISRSGKKLVRALRKKLPDVIFRT